MRTKKRTPDYGAISRSSIKKDFQRAQRYPTEEKTPQIEELPKINAERRIIDVYKRQLIKTAKNVFIEHLRMPIFTTFAPAYITFIRIGRIWKPQ